MHPFQIANLNFQILLRGIQGTMAEKLRDVRDIHLMM
jgi:hypothetical protein